MASNYVGFAWECVPITPDLGHRPASRHRTFLLESIAGGASAANTTFWVQVDREPKGLSVWYDEVVVP